MSSAESIFYRKFFEVHSGADSVKKMCIHDHKWGVESSLAGYVSSTLQISREDFKKSLLEWNRG